jgi:hypothetical protein
MFCNFFAGVRGEHALKVVKYRRLVDNKLKESKKGLKESVALAEKLRAAQVRCQCYESCWGRFLWYHLRLPPRRLEL